MATLPAYLAEQTEEAIRQRMLSSVPPDLDKSEGSFIWDSLSPAAIELALAAIQANEVLRRGFAGTSFGPYLELRCQEHGVSRKNAVKAWGEVKLLGVPGTIVPAGTRVGTPADSVAGTSSVVFETLETVTMPSSGNVTVPIAAIEGGASGNIPAGGISLLLASPAGLTGVTQTTPTSGGLDVESDASLLNRYYAKVRSPGTSGNKSDYLNWALEVPGVGGAQVLPLWNGPGTVKVVLIGADKRSASTQVVNAVQQYIAPAAPLTGKAPIGAAVTVVKAQELMINISAQLSLTGVRTLSQIKDDFTAAFQSYLAELAFASDPTVRYVRVGSLLLDTAGVQDYTNLQMNGAASNISIGPETIAVAGTVTLT